MMSLSRRPVHPGWYWLLAIGAATCALAAEDAPKPAQPETPKSDVKPKGDPQIPNLPGISIDRKNKVVDLEAKVILPLQADWLELLACMPKSREHESALSIVAKPSHVHGALLLIGLEPGSPGRSERIDDVLVYHPPKGPGVAVTIVFEKEGKQIEVPANEWVLEQKTKKPLADNVWLFVGSTTYEVDGKGVYVADVEGNIISLVNFGNEVLARDTKNRGGQGGGGGDTWGANSKVIPAVGTKVIVRLKPAPVRKEEEKK